MINVRLTQVGVIIICTHVICTEQLFVVGAIKSCIEGDNNASRINCRSKKLVVPRPEAATGVT